MAVMTASRALRGEASVRPHLAARVREAAAELDYRPNVMARALRNGRSDLVAFAVHELSNPFYGTLVEALSRQMADTGLQLVLFPTGEPVAEQRRSLGLSGCVLLRASPESLRAAARAMPVVSIARDPACPDVAPDVAPDFDWAYRAAAEKALANGRRRFAFACLEHHLPWNYRKKFVFVDQVLAAHGQEKVAAVAHTPRAAAELAAKNHGAVDTLFCPNDVYAAQVMVELQRVGLRCPEDVLLFGCDGTLPVRGVWSIIPNYRELAVTVAGLLKRVVAGERLTGQWIIRPELRWWDGGGWVA